MKLVVGLGNPGSKYAGTRHNVGFEVLAEVARRLGAHGPKVAFQGELATAEVSGEKVLLLCPHTFMNLSGGSVLAARDFYKLALEDLLIVSDDIALPLGRLRFRARGSAGGQKGLADVLRRLGSQDVSRLRIGIDAPPPGWDAADYVLGRFTAGQRRAIGPALVRAADGVCDWIRHGIEHCMNQYNAEPD
jgi:PTH1 family peptidyl-tRNA hydrolase